MKQYTLIVSAVAFASCVTPVTLTPYDDNGDPAKEQGKGDARPSGGPATGGTAEGGRAGGGNNGEDGIGGKGGNGGKDASAEGSTGGTSTRPTGGSGASAGGTTGKDASLPGPDAPSVVGGDTLHWVAYGDTRTNVSTHQKVVDAFAKLNPQFVVHSGDLWDGYPSGSTQWAGVLNKNANIAALLKNNLFLVAQGNHEDASEVLNFKPPIVRNGSVRYSFTMGNSFFVVLGMDPSSAAAVTFATAQLASPAAKAATWRFAFSHYPVYSGGDHPNAGYPSLEKAFDDGNLSIHFAGHDHNYQRSYQLFGAKPADMGDAVMASKGTVYVVSGGGGAPLYPVKKTAKTKVVASTSHFVEVNSTATTITVKSWDTSGKMLDTFTVTR